MFSQTSEAIVYTSELEEFRLRVVPVKATAYYNCTYAFSSAQEMVEKTQDAIDLTLLHLSLGEFAFHPISHLK